MRWAIPRQYYRSHGNCHPRPIWILQVCAAPFQPSAVTAFFRLLILPPHALRSIVHLIPFDLSPPSHSPTQLRLGLVRLGTNKRATNRAYASTGSPHGQPAMDTNTSTQSPDFIPGLPGILVRPPRITLQLLVLQSPPSIQVVSSPIFFREFGVFLSLLIYLCESLLLSIINTCVQLPQHPFGACIVPALSVSSLNLTEKLSRSSFIELCLISYHKMNVYLYL